jgi:uncharacterized protein (DUF1499 family)
MRWLRRLLGLALSLGIALVLTGQAGLLQGAAPSDLGVREGRLKAPSPTPNSVSSQADLHPDHPMRESALIAPLPLQEPVPQAMARLRSLATALPGARVEEASAGYLRLSYTTRWLRFVDDAEFWADPAAGVIHVRSASRLGRRDFGVNRARIETLRARWVNDQGPLHPPGTAPQ